MPNICELVPRFMVLESFLWRIISSNWASFIPIYLSYGKLHCLFQYLCKQFTLYFSLFFGMRQNYCYIQDVVENTCHEYGVPYQSEPNLFIAYVKMLRHLKFLGRNKSAWKLLFFCCRCRSLKSYRIIMCIYRLKPLAPLWSIKALQSIFQH